MNTHSFRAMGCTIQVWGDVDEFVEVEAIFASAETRFSRFLPNSELSQLNQQPNRWIEPSNEMWTVLQLAMALSAETNGIFDPFQLIALEDVGYDRTFEMLGERSSGYAIRKDRRQRHSRNTGCVRLDEANRAIFLPEGVQIDLGGIVKGYTAQQAIDYLRPYGACLIDASGDLVAGDAPRGNPGWPVGVDAPFSAEENMLRLWLSNRSLATSGIDRRRWQTDQGARHHIIDPRTGDSAETDLHSATIWANDASTADAYATASMVLGVDAAYALLTERFIGAALVDTSGRLLLTPALEPFVQVESGVQMRCRSADLRLI